MNADVIRQSFFYIFFVVVFVLIFFGGAIGLTQFSLERINKKMNLRKQENSYVKKGRDMAKRFERKINRWSLCSDSSYCFPGLYVL